MLSNSETTKFAIDYQVESSGWANVSFSNGDTVARADVSYLHDSLQELAQLALDLKAGFKELKVTFVDEPGETCFKVNIIEGKAYYKFLYFKDWVSMGMGSESNSEVLLEGTCDPMRITHQICNNLWNIYENIGLKKYKELWGEHEFPLSEYKKLQKL